MPSPPACDVIATATFMYHQRRVVPCRIVFTVVRDPTQQYIVEPLKHTCSFTYDDVLINQEKMGNPLALSPPPLGKKTLQVHVRQMDNYLSGDFYLHYLQDAWHKDVVGCVDNATYLYLLDLLPHVKLLSPDIMEGRLEYLSIGKDPIVSGTEAANRLLADMDYSGLEGYWDIGLNP